MNEIQTTLLNHDTLSISIPADRFVKNCHDTTIERESIIFQEKSEIKSLFTGHLLRTDNVQPHVINKYTPDWILGLLILCFIILAWVQLFYRKRFRQLLQAPFSKRFMNQLVREGNPFNERLSLALGLIYFIGTALLIFAMNDLLLGGHTPLHLREFSFYLMIILVLVLFWLVKVLTIRLLGTVFKTENTTRMYLLNELILNIITGLILIPILILVIYLKSILFLYISLALIILSFLFLFARGFMIGLSLTKFSYIFLFVYLCSLEILPLIILVKFSLIFYNSMISVE
jgi:Domain of unknown function (DUF4271)